MNALPNSHEFSERYRIAFRRERTAGFVAIAPGFLYVIQHLLRDGRPLPGFAPRVDEWLLYFLGAWAVAVLFAFARNTLKKAGLTCPQCKCEFRNTSFDSVMARGICPNCSTKILADVDATTATATEELTFRYGRGRAVFLLLSAVAAAGMGAFMIIGFTSILLGSEFSPKRTIAGLSLILLGFAFVALAAVLGRTWRSLFTEYSLSGAGVAARYRGESIFHPWTNLHAARYGRFTGQLTLVFRGGFHPVVLSNAEEDQEETTLKLAKALVERRGNRRIEKTLL